MSPCHQGKLTWSAYGIFFWVSLGWGSWAAKIQCLLDLLLALGKIAQGAEQIFFVEACRLQPSSSRLPLGPAHGLKAGTMMSDAGQQD